ncbi:lasso peptide biosynthesis B2 protein [Sphingomonas sp. NFX23]|uniref:lasso peptide biosynthesis B2 protein n=1 Tax=Sphingomonas sp. NFX23 TaxID=2819532 RepID=UPI003CF29B07
MRRAITALTMGPARQALVIEAAASLLAARLRLRLRSFGRITAELGRFVPPAPAPAPVGAPVPVDPVRRRRISQIRWAIAVAAPLMPFRAVCLQRSLAGRAMLARRGIDAILHFGGTVRAGAPDSEHAWLTADGIGVAGYPIDPAMVEIGRIVPRG